MGKTFKNSVYSMAKASTKKTKTLHRAKLQPYDRKTFKRMTARLTATNNIALIANLERNPLK